MPWAALILGIVGAAAIALDRHRNGMGDSRAARLTKTAFADIRTTVLARDAWPIVIGASIVAVAGHATAFIVAAQTAGTPASAIDLLPLALIVLAAMAIPLSVAGWGPREGVAAWAFAAAGLGAAAGVTTAVVYGVMALVASLPGAVVLLVAAVRQRSITREEAVHG